MITYSVIGASGKYKVVKPYKCEAITAAGAFGIQSTCIDIHVYRNSVGADLNETMAVLYLAASTDAADGAKDKSSKFWKATFGRLLSEGRLACQRSMRSRNWSSVVERGIFEIGNAYPADEADGLAALFAGICIPSDGMLVCIAGRLNGRW